VAAQIIFVNGVQSAGKSTVARKLARREPAFRVLANDELIRAVPMRERLQRHRELWTQVEDSGIDLPLEDNPTFTYPDAHRVRLDVGTGVCVANEQLGGTRNGTGHDLAIETVDDRWATSCSLHPSPRAGRGSSADPEANRVRTPVWAR
jgi:hypothetical protein